MKYKKIFTNLRGQTYNFDKETAQSKRGAGFIRKSDHPRGFVVANMKKRKYR